MEKPGRPAASAHPKCDHPEKKIHNHSKTIIESSSVDPGSAGHAQRFLSAFSGISPHFRPGRHRLSTTEYRREMTDRFTTWNQVTGAATAA